MAETVTETLIDMILIDSNSYADKSEILKYAVDWLKGLGMEVDIFGEKATPSICAYNGIGGLAFSGHLDTVPKGVNWTREQGEVDGGRVYGRGAADMKGACACMLQAAQRLMDDDLDFYVLFTTDEEVRMDGAKVLARTHGAKNAQGIVIGEPTDMRVAYKEKGVSSFVLKTKGTAAHASMPWLGDNAIVRMSHILEKIKDVGVAPELPNGVTFNITTIKGGVKNNVIPDVCEVDIDVRLPFPVKAAQVEEMVRKRLIGEKYEIVIPYEMPAFQTDPSSPLVKLAVERLGTAPVEMPYATEAAVYSSVNKHIMICGPGKAEMAHAADEYVEREQLEKTLALYVALAKQAVQG
ncbi:MAG TPA: M20/M25/M40 family metallo-hydrolase [Methanomassiliicoccales archaeon]|nr:M20/M25/M40 family metallo-hydrolase [Methanomassiliicoccales archaeon]